MTPDQVALVQDSFKRVVPIATTAADLFYDRLFAIAPQLRPLFPTDLREQKTKLIAMLATVVANLHQLEKMMAQAEQLGKRHVRYGVTGDHYAPVGEALIWTLEQGLGAEFTPSVKAAWTEAFRGPIRRNEESRRREPRLWTSDYQRRHTEANGDRLELERPETNSAVLGKPADLRQFSSVSKFQRVLTLSRVSPMDKPPVA
jgi:hemoglobin-like flavoprotein